MLKAPWWLLVRQAGESLVRGRFWECERLTGEAARLEPAEAAPLLLAAVARREQGRPSEAEVLVRALLAEHPGLDEGQALLGAVLADLGRDGEARRQLDLLRESDAWSDAPGVAALAAEAVADLDATEHAEAIEAALASGVAGLVGGAGRTGWYGSPARHLGLLCHVLGRWDEADAHFRVALDADRAAGAPVHLAHTRRQYSALLRARGADGDWERAIGLLAQAATVYRRLDIGRMADDAEAVLRRSQDPAPAGVDDGPGVFRPAVSEGAMLLHAGEVAAARWKLAFDGREAVVVGGAGMAHVAVLLAAGGRPVHVLDLVAGAADGNVAANTGIAAEYRARLAEFERDAACADPVEAALDRAEADLLSAELATLYDPAGHHAATDPTDRARRLVALRIRTALAQIEAELPALSGHLRRSLRTGTFWLYEPEWPTRWRITR